MIDLTAFTGTQDITAANFSQLVTITAQGTGSYLVSYFGQTLTVNAAGGAGFVLGM